MTKRAIACVATMAILGFAPAAFAKDGAPNPNSCGVGSAEAHQFQADPSSPGASEINQYPPGEFGCTGPKGK